MPDISEQQLRDKVTESTYRLLGDFYSPNAMSESQLKTLIARHIDQIMDYFKKYGEVK